MLTELASHPTVEYIKALEEERDFYKQQAAEAGKQQRQLRVALDAHQRRCGKCVPAACPRARREWAADARRRMQDALRATKTRLQRTKNAAMRTADAYSQLAGTRTRGSQSGASLPRRASRKLP